MKLLPSILCIPLMFAPLAGAADKNRPNILFILTDDQAPFDFRFHNPQSTLDSPQIDRLAAHGMIFDSAVHMGAFMGAVCTPSRHMIMSGRTLWRLPIGPGGKTCPPNLERNTIGAVFNRAGYATMRTCKQGNSYPDANRQFSVVHDATKRGGTHESGSGWHADRVLDYLKDRETNKDSRPFFIYFGLSHPHDVRDGTPELLAKYGAVNHRDPSAPPPLHPKQPPLPPNWLPVHPFDNTHMKLRDETQVSGVWRRRDEATIRNEIGREYACGENIDIQIGRVLAKLEAMGELDNTYVFYTADHGIAIGRHGLQGKQNLYEHSWRVPMIVKGPGIKPGSRVPGNIYLGDLLATLCDLTGIPVPETNEGLSFKPVLMGEKPAIRETLYGAYNGGDKPGMRCVKHGDWKLIEYESSATGARETQLFNLKDNPHEFIAAHHAPKVVALTGVKPDPKQTNLATDPQHAAKLEEMRALLLAEMRRLGDPWRFSGQPRDGIAPPSRRRSVSTGKADPSPTKREARRTSAGVHHAQGEMAGEVTTDSVLLQSRLTAIPGPDLDGNGDVPGAAGVARYELSPADDFTGARQTEWLRADPERDYIVRARVTGLQPGTRYYYRLILGVDESSAEPGPTRQFRTLPSAESSGELSFIMGSCQNYAFFMNGPDGHGNPIPEQDKRLGFPVYEAMRKLKPDFFIGAGDVVYYDHPAKTAARSLPELRRKWHEQFRLPRLVEFYGQTAAFWLKDDHDFRFNDADPGGADEPSTETGIRVFREQMPVLPMDDNTSPTYRTHRVHQHLQLWFVEGRDHRSSNNMPDGPEKSIWGREQRGWLERTLLESDATWKVIVSPTPMVGPDRNSKRDNHANLSGFKHEGEDFFNWAKSRGISRLLTFCGDRHWQYHSVHPSGAEEFSCGALNDENSIPGVRPGSKASTDPEGRIRQPFLYEKPSGGFLHVTLGDASLPPGTLRISLLDDEGTILHTTDKKP